jgi:hypothetical protein
MVEFLLSRLPYVDLHNDPESEQRRHVFSNETEPDFITEPSSEERLTPSTNKGPLHPNRNTSFSHRFQAHQAGLKFSAPTTTQSRHSPSSPPKKSAIIFHDEHFFFLFCSNVYEETGRGFYNEPTKS